MDFFATIDWSEWGPPLAVIALGLVCGFVLVSRLREEDPAVQAQSRELDLKNEHAVALAALKALETERDKLDPADWEREREALLARGSAALRALDQAAPEARPSTADPEAVAKLRALVDELGDDAARSAVEALFGPTQNTPPAPAGLSPEWRGALWALGVVAVMAGFVMFANTESVDRRPGASMTGNQDLGGADRKAELEARVKQDPQDLEALNELTIIAIQAGDAPGAMEWNRQAFEVNADDPTARTWKAVLAAAVGMSDRALAILTETAADHPEHLDAWMYKGLIELRSGDAAAAVTSLEKAQALDPGNPQLGAALSQARQVAAASGGGPAAPPTAGGPAEVVVQGTAALSDELQATLSGSETLYVSVRSPAGGPPLAAKKMPMGEWPRAFEVTTADAIAMGGRPRPFPDTLRVVVTIDGDGNPMSKGDVVATIDLSDVAKGTEDLAVELTPPG